MSALNDFQFEILPSAEAADGEVFGIGSNVSMDDGGFHPGSTEWATQNVQSTTSGATLYGRDVLLGPTWAWDLHVNRDELDNALETLGAFSTAWRWLDERSTHGKVTAIRYRLADRVRRVYGRPNMIEASPNNLILSGYTPITCDFVCADGFTYDDTEDTITITVGEADSGAGGGGWTWPLTFPYGSALPTEQAAPVVVGGDAPTHPIIRFNGPVSNPVLETDEWRVALNYEILTGQYVEIDTRPWANTVLLNGSSSIAGALGRRIKLPNVVLKPGTLEARFIGTSATGTATCTLRWASAYNSI